MQVADAQNAKSVLPSQLCCEKGGFALNLKVSLRHFFRSLVPGENVINNFEQSAVLSGRGIGGTVVVRRQKL